MNRPSHAIFGALVYFAAMASTSCATDNVPPEKNGVPVANAGADREVGVGDVVNLNAGASVDPDGDELSFRWQLETPLGSAAQLENLNDVITSFVADVPGEYTVTLVATDGLADSDPDVAHITASGSLNQAPLADAGGDRTVAVGEPVRLDGTASFDPDGDALFFDWFVESGPDGFTSTIDDPFSPTPTLVPDRAGRYVVSLIVSDGELESDPVAVTITAQVTNEPPVADAGRDISIATAETAQLDGSASFDPEGGGITYSWTLVSKPDGSSSTLSAPDLTNPTLTPDVDGVYTVELVVHDGENPSAPDQVLVTAATGNLPPVADAGPDVSVMLGETVQLDGADSDDPDGGALTYSWSVAVRPSGSLAALSDPAAVAPTFVPDIEGFYDIELVVSDGEDSSPADTVRVTANAPNQTPIAGAGADQRVRAGNTVMLDGSDSNDPDGDSLSFAWSLTFKPTGSNAALVGANSVNPTFVPDLAGTYSAELVVNDGRVDSAPDLVTIIVSNPWPAAEGEIILTEVMVDPADVTDEVGEWIELYNPSSTKAYDLEDCEISDLDIDSHIIATPLVVPPQTYVVLARSATPGFTPDYVYGNEFQLHNSGDEVVLACNNIEISNLLYDPSVGFTIAVGASLTLQTSQFDETANDQASSWCDSAAVYGSTDRGTPGAPNEFASSCN